MLALNLGNIDNLFHQKKTLGLPGIEPRAAGCEARIPSIVLCDPFSPPTMPVCLILLRGCYSKRFFPGCGGQSHNSLDLLSSVGHPQVEIQILRQKGKEGLWSGSKYSKDIILGNPFVRRNFSGIGSGEKKWKWVRDETPAEEIF